MSKQTAVEWLKDQIKDYDYSNNDGMYFFKIPFYMFQEKIEQALAMEREQIEEAYGHGQNNGYMYANQKAITIRKDQYYNKTYKGANYE